MIHLTVPNFLYDSDNSFLGCLKCKKHAIFSTFSNFPKVFGYIFTQKVLFCKYKENWEYLNILFPIFFVKHFLLYLELRLLLMITKFFKCISEAIFGAIFFSSQGFFFCPIFSISVYTL